MYIFMTLPYYERTVVTSLFGPALRVHDLQRTASHTSVHQRIICIYVELTSALPSLHDLNSN